MIHRPTPRGRVAKRVVAALLASAFLIVGSPVAASSAASGGAHRSVSASFGDCKNDNSGKHNGYDCPQSSGSGTSGDVILVY
jgi:hypothetical protein